jgi:hypothetical protein
MHRSTRVLHSPTNYADTCPPRDVLNLYTLYPFSSISASNSDVLDPYQLMLFAWPEIASDHCYHTMEAWTHVIISQCTLFATDSFFYLNPTLAFCHGRKKTK